MRLPGRRPGPARYRNPVLALPGVDHGDPYVLETPQGYVLYHTGGARVPACTSRDLVTWQPHGPVLEAGGWAQVDLWAPEVVRRGEEHLMYVAATAYDAAGRPDDGARRLGLARSPDPLGPFRWDAEPVLPDTWSVDGHVHRDPAGSDWLFWSGRDARTRHPDGRPGCGTVADRLLRPDLTAGLPALVTTPDAAWEGDAPGTFFWNEGPWVVRRQGRLVQLYSGGWWGDDTYGVGVATAPAPNGPWRKDPRNPVLRSGKRLTGPGHCCLVTGPDAFSTYAVYGAHPLGARRRVVVVDRLRWLDGAFVVGAHETVPSRPGERPQPVPPPAVVDRAVPHWRRRLWWEGGAVAVSGVVLDPGPGVHLLVVSWALGQAHVRLDGLDVAVPAGPPQVDASAAGVLADTLSSGLEDEAQRTLAPGEVAAWPWGGAGPVEAALSVRGEALVRLGDQVRRVQGDERTGLVLHAPGAEALTVQATGPAQVGDVELVARP